MSPRRPAPPRLPRRSNPLGPEALRLLRYLEQGVDPADFLSWLPTFFRETGRTPPEGFDARWPQYLLDEPEWPEIAEDFRPWILHQAYEQASRSALHAPAYLFLEHPELLRHDTWLVHFSDRAPDIAREGFARGFRDMTRVSHTRRVSTARPVPGWNYAYRAEGHEAQNAADCGTYGDAAVLFRSGGVEVHHTADRERQVLFWGPHVRTFVLLESDGALEGPGLWLVRDRRSRRVLRKGPWREVVRWAIEHHRQYAAAIVREADPSEWLGPAARSA